MGLNTLNLGLEVVFLFSLSNFEFLISIFEFLHATAHFRSALALPPSDRHPSTPSARATPNKLVAK